MITKSKAIKIINSWFECLNYFNESWDSEQRKKDYNKLKEYILTSK